MMVVLNDDGVIGRRFLAKHRFNKTLANLNFLDAVHNNPTAVPFI